MRQADNGMHVLYAKLHVNNPTASATTAASLVAFVLAARMFGYDEEFLGLMSSLAPVLSARECLERPGLTSWSLHVHAHVRVSVVSCAYLARADTDAECSPQ